MEVGDKNGDHPETSNTTPPIPPPTQQILHTVSYIKLPILKKVEYDIWAMKMEHYLCHTDYPIWQVIQNGNGPVSVTIDTHGLIKVLPLKTVKEVVARERERKERTTLLMALSEDHLEKFHLMADAKEMWEAIKSKFGGNDESKKIQKYLLKQQFKEIHCAGVSNEDANQKFLRSLPSSWSQVALIIRTKPGLDTLSFDDLYNNLRVFEHDVKGTTASSITTQNMAFVSGENTRSTNTVSIAHSVSSSSINDDDMEEIDLKWQMAMISMRIKKFHKRTGRKLQFDTKDTVGFDKTKEDSNALVTVDGEDIDWSGHVEEDAKNYTMLAYSNSCSDNESSADDLDSKTSDYASCESDSSVEPSTSTPEPVVNESKVVSEPKVFTMSNTHQELASPEANSFCNELASPKQTALGKDELNPLIVDSLLKKYMVINAPCYSNEALATPEQTAASKETSNPALVLKPPPGMNLAALWYQQSSVLTNQKFNFSRYILLSLVKNIEAGVPFYMFPRFVQLIVDHQLGDMSHHQDIYDKPSLTKKVFANMKRVGTGFSRVITPLFKNMLVSTAKEVGQAQDDQPKAPMVPSLKSSQEHIIPSLSNDPIPDADKASLKFQELMDLCTRLSNKVLDLESEVIDIKSSFIDKIEKHEDRVHKIIQKGRMIADMDEDVEVNLEEAQAKTYNLDLQHSKKVLNMQDIDEEEPAKAEQVLKVVTSAKLITEVVTTTEPTIAAQVPKASSPRRRRGIVIQDPEETAASVIVHIEVQPKDKGKGILI
nr:ribonuclease H-like domain-containing protein [Tanacetum cinerariifolium]